MQRRQYIRIRDNLTPRGARVYPVNPGRSQVLGDPAYPSLASLPAPVDVAAVLLRDPLPAVADCVAAGAKFAIVMSADYGDAEGTEASAAEEPSQRRLRELASGATRVIGPNTAIQVFENWRRDLPGQRLAVVTHSGHLGRPIVQAETMGIPIEAWIALGNEVDVEWADAVHYFAGVPSVGAIASYVEGFGDGRTLMSAADAAARAGVPLICIKVGRSEAGRSVALSHTGHLTGSDAVYDAVFEQYGVIRVDDIDELVEIAGLFCHARLPEGGKAAGSGRRVAVYGLSGAVAAHAVDMCAAGGLRVERFTQPTIDAIAGLLPPYLRRDNPVDAGGVITLTADNLTLMNLMRDDPNADMLFVPIVGPEAPFTDAVARDAIELHRSGGKPVIVAWTSAARDCGAYRDVCAAGVPLFHSFGAAVRGMAELSRWTAFRAAYRTPAVELPESRAEVADQARRLLATGQVLSEVDSGLLLSLYGIPVVTGQVVTSARAAWRAAQDLGAPAVVLKAVSAVIGHKSDLGLVLTGLRGQSGIVSGYQRLMARAREVAPAGRLDGVLVQPMIDGVVAEVILGLSRQPPFGLTITYGLGGVITELFADVAHAVPPLDRRHVAAMIAKTRSSALLRGFRGSEPGDVEALTDAILALARLAVDLGEDIAELDINPLLVRAAGAGVVAVDALIVPAAGSGQGLPVADHQGRNERALAQRGPGDASRSRGHARGWSLPAGRNSGKRTRSRQWPTCR
jgi:acyl-CoA synthetase (NDP forming)